MRRETILVIEGHDDVRDAFAAVLDYYGFHVLAARDGEEGGRLARADRPSLVLMDVSGVETDGAGPVHPFGGDAGVPVVGLALESPTREERARLEEELAGLLVKPVRPDQLLAEIRRVLGSGTV